jgi:hypothetical protein
MNKEEVIECFFKDRELDPKMIKFAEIYNKYLSKVAIQPANLERIETITNRSEITDKKSSLEKTLSICSAFSRVTIDQNIYSDIVKNRKNHNIFLDLEDDDPKEKKWYYKDEKENIFGPYSSE